MTTSALKLITLALRMLGVIGEGQSPSGPQGADGLILINQLLDGWGIDGEVSVLSYLRTAQALTPNVQDYTIGSGGTINIVRPQWIAYARVIPDTSLAAAQQTERPVRILTPAEWASKVLKSLTNAYPTELYDDHTYSAADLGTLKVWPIPTGAAVSLVLYTPLVLTQFTGLATAVHLARGYDEAIASNLAKKWAPFFGKTAADIELVLAEAARTKGLVETANTTVPVMVSDSALRRGGDFDMRSGQ